MTEFEILNQLIKDAAKILPLNENGKVSVTLNEPQTQDSSVVIVGIPQDAMIIKVDVFQSRMPYFSVRKVSANEQTMLLSLTTMERSASFISK
jgi:tRNA G26 N,N-dimethylase Trm1